MILSGALLVGVGDKIGPGPLTAAATASLSNCLTAQGTRDEITRANWRQHPKIKSIRTLVQSVTAGMRGKSLSVSKRTFEYCEPYQDTERTIARDPAGRTRYYKNQGGSEDSSVAWEHYYDVAGHPRFIFITGGAVNGSELEHRIYFDEAGKRIWEEQTYKKGPGYTFPENWPDDSSSSLIHWKSFCQRQAALRLNRKPGSGSVPANRYEISF